MKRALDEPWGDRHKEGTALHFLHSRGVCLFLSERSATICGWRVVGCWWVGESQQVQREGVAEG